MAGKKHIRAALLSLILLTVHSSANSLAIFRTTLGEMTAVLFDEDKPNTVANFISIVERGYYANNFVHVCVPGVIVQGGGFRVLNSTSANSISDIFAVPNLGQITNEFSLNAAYSNVFGTIAMAKISGNPDSASSQCFFNLGSNPAFNTNNGGFTVFGRVLTGTNVLEQFNTKSNMFGTVNIGAPFQNLPVTYVGNSFPRYNELIYSGISIFQIFILPDTDGTRRLLWNSPSAMSCHVEYQESLDGPWQILHVTNGNGLIQAAVDTNTVAPYRKYRVRVQ